jgi:hypothetical protein
MALKTASTTLRIAHTKSQSAPNASAKMEIQLASGDVSTPSVVSWTASSSKDWLVISDGTASGTVSSESPVAELSLTVNAGALNDTLVSGPLTATITVLSTIDGRRELFEDGTSSTTMQVEVSISATPSIMMQDVVIKTSSGVVLEGGTINAGNTLTVIVRAFDFTRAPIFRSTLEIRAELACVGREGWKVNLQHKTSNVYFVEVPGEKLDEPGDYTLSLSPRVESVKATFAVAKSKRNLYIAGGMSPLLLGLLVAMGVLAYKNRKRYRAFLLSFINFEGLLVLEVRARMLAGGCARPRWLLNLFLRRFPSSFMIWRAMRS